MPKLEIELTDTEWERFQQHGGPQWLRTMCQPHLMHVSPVVIAQHWIIDQLETGPKEVAGLFIAAAARGIKRSTLGRAKRSLGVVSVPTGFAAGRVWYWRLPMPGDELGLKGEQALT